MTAVEFDWLPTGVDGSPVELPDGAAIIDPSGDDFLVPFSDGSHVEFALADPSGDDLLAAGPTVGDLLSFDPSGVGDGVVDSPDAVSPYGADVDGMGRYGAGGYGVGGYGVGGDTAAVMDQINHLTGSVPVAGSVEWAEGLLAQQEARETSGTSAGTESPAGDDGSSGSAGMIQNLLRSNITHYGGTRAANPYA